MTQTDEAHYQTACREYDDAMMTHIIRLAALVTTPLTDQTNDANPEPSPPRPAQLTQTTKDHNEE
eukprot:593494-Heterocapsa_arctica.AAC.1